MRVIIDITEELTTLVLFTENDLLLELMLLFSHLIDAFDQVDVVFHEAGVVFTMLLQVAGKLRPVVTNVGLVGVALSSIGFICVDIGLLAIGLFLDPGLVEANHSFLELLVVLDVLHDFEDVIFEAFLLQLLHIQLVTAVQVLIFKTLVSHLEIIDDQIKVVTDALEMFHFNLHLVDLFMER